MPTTTPDRAERGSSTVPSSVAATIWQPSTSNRMLLSVCSGCSSRRSDASGALVAFFGEREQPDAADARERGLRQREHAGDRPRSTTTTTIAIDVHASVRRCVRSWTVRCAHGPVPRLELAKPRQQLLLAPPHRRPSPRARRGRSRAGAARRARRAARARRRRASPRSRGLAARDGRAHDDVAEQRRRIARIGRRARTASTLVGLAPAGRQLVVDREREHVGRARRRRGSAR